MVAVVAIVVIALGALKIYDFVAASAFVVRHRSGTVTEGSGDTRIDLGWTPVFSCAAKWRARWKAEGREGSVRDRLLSVAVDVIFRGPVLACLQAAALLIVAGGASGTAVARGQACEFAGEPPVGAMLMVAAAIACVMVSAMGIVTLLLVMALAPSGEVEVVAGQYLHRTRGGPADRRPFGPIMVVPAVTLALFASFAALYLCLFRADPSAFAVTPCSVDAATMIYFSTSIGATVGFGDITATSDVARLIVSCEVISFVTMLTLFLQTMWLRRADIGADLAESRPPDSETGAVTRGSTEVPGQPVD